MIVVVIIGLLAVMAVPAFQKSRAASQDKTVFNNLRQLSSAADEYFLEKGATEVETTVLVGTNSTQYIRHVFPVAAESYSSPIQQGAGLTASGVANARTITISN